jgi:diketogulonate reductase-like aldo/keto reductase
LSTVVIPRTTKTLPGGAEIPRLGLGVFRAGEETKGAVLAAIGLGYRLIDTARIYRNEAAVGAAIRECGVPREDIFVTTKLWNDDHGYDETLRAFDASAKELGLDYVDLYLVHWPVSEKRKHTWRAMEKLHRDKRCRAIGVSNYMTSHLDELLASADLPPSVNQIELHPFLQQRDVVRRCREAGIVIEAYSPLAKGLKMDHPKLVAIANRLGRSVAQVMIRWSLEKGYVCIPKSANRARIAENAQAMELELSFEDMRALDGLEEGLRTAWDPTTVD